MAGLIIDMETVAAGLKHEPADQVSIALSVRAAVQRFDKLNLHMHRALNRAADPDYKYRSGKQGAFEQVTAEQLAEKFNGYGVLVPQELQACGRQWIPEMASYACGCILAYEEYINEVEQKGEL